MIQALAPAEWAPTVGDEVELLDAESGETIATRLGAAELAAYEERLQAFVGSVKHECGRLGIAYVALDSGSTLDEVVFRQLPSAGILR